MIKQFLEIVKRYFRPYKAYILWAIVLNFVTQWLNVFSFVVLIPILNILFKIDQTVYTYKEWTWSTLNKDLIVNNGYALVQELIRDNGAFITLCLMGAILIFMTGLKCIGYWGAANIMMPHRWRTATEQLPAVAGCLLRTLLHRHLLAGLRRGVPMQGYP